MVLKIVTEQAAQKINIAKHLDHQIFLLQLAAEKYVLSLWIHREFLPLLRYIHCTKRAEISQIPVKNRLAL